MALMFAGIGEYKKPADNKIFTYPADLLSLNFVFRNSQGYALQFRWYFCSAYIVSGQLLC